MLPNKQRIQTVLADEEFVELEKLSAMGYTIGQMAMYFNKKEKDFADDAADDETKIAYHIARGKLVSLAQEQMNILTAAEGGNISASQQIANIRRTRGFQISKEEIFNGFENKKNLRVFEEWVQGGCKQKLSKEETLYLEALSMVDKMDRKYGRRNTIIFFTKAPFNLSASRAVAMYDEAINLFNTDRNINKKAFRNKYADELDEMAIVVRDNALTAKDAEVFGNLKVQAGRMRGLDEKEPDPISKELYIKPVRYFGLTTDVVSLPPINRQEIADFIDGLEIPEEDKRRVSADALLTNIDLTQQLNELEEESKLR